MSVGDPMIESWSTIEVNQNTRGTNIAKGNQKRTIIHQKMIGHGMETQSICIRIQIAIMSNMISMRGFVIEVSMMIKTVLINILIEIVINMTELRMTNTMSDRRKNELEMLNTSINGQRDLFQGMIIKYLKQCLLQEMVGLNNVRSLSSSSAASELLD